MWVTDGVIQHYPSGGGTIWVNILSLRKVGLMVLEGATNYVICSDRTPIEANKTLLTSGFLQVAEDDLLRCQTNATNVNDFSSNLFFLKLGQKRTNPKVYLEVNKTPNTFRTN